MKVNMGTKLQTLDGKPLIDQGKPVLLKDAIIAALLSTPQSDKLDAAEKVARYELALKCNVQESIDLTIEDVAKIKKLVGELHSILVVGQISHILEGKQ
ncbi:MAG TPA: hypothetical protein EYP19_15065 [Desulfobacterales bacterium]|nr:hypothetical protein [Desulfobacterales bacterium]